MAESENAIQIFNRYKSTLKITSKESNANVYMTNSMYPAINFDSVKRKYKKPNFCGLRSNDALLLPPVGYDKYVFIEFKDGHIEDRKNITEITEKIYESLLLFNEITRENISYDKSHVVYILVFNEGDNSKFASNAHLAKLANKKYIVPELERYKKLFVDFSTITKADFCNITNRLDRNEYPF